MANGNNAVVSAKASLNEARGMFNIGDLSEKGYMRELKKAEKVLTPKQIQDTIRKFDNLEDVPEKARSFKKKKVSGSDISATKGRPGTRERVAQVRKATNWPEAHLDAPLRVKRPSREERAAGKGRRIVDWEEAARQAAMDKALDYQAPIKKAKGGLPKKPKFMKGGSYKGKPHMYAAGGMVKELKI